jgi:phosphotransferase system HPr-like phosphotransfer protein
MSPSSDAHTTVVLPANLHARPAGKLAQAAARFTSTIRIEHPAAPSTPPACCR